MHGVVGNSVVSLVFLNAALQIEGNQRPNGKLWEIVDLILVNPHQWRGAFGGPNHPSGQLEVAIFLLKH